MVLTDNEKNEIIKCFPMESFYKYQKEALFKIVESFKKYNTVMVELPTGIGKSPIAMTLLNYFNGGYILTNQKSLQNQYLNVFSNNIKKVDGRSNYICLHSETDLNNEDKLNEEGLLTELNNEDELNEEGLLFDIDGNIIDININNKKINTCGNGKCIENSSFECPYKPSPKYKDGGIFAAKTPYHTMYWNPFEILHCPYWDQKCEAINFKNVIHNYNYFLNEANYIKHFGKREILICDEGHNIEKQIIDFNEFTINKEDIQDFSFYFKKYNTDIVKWKKNLQKLYEQLPCLIENLENQIINVNKQIDNSNKKIIDRKKLIDNINVFIINICNEIQLLDNKKIRNKNKIIKNKNNDIEIHKKNILEINETKKKIEFEKLNLNGEKSKLMKELNIKRNLLKKLKYFLRYSKNPKNWLIIPEYNNVDDDNTVIKLKFKPYIISEFIEDQLFKFGKKRLIMSATITDKNVVMKNLGLNDSNCCFIQFDPFFPAENKPIYHLNVAKFSKSNLDENNENNKIQEMVDAIDLILDVLNEKGIIHTTTYVIANLIKDRSRHKDRILTHNKLNRQEIIDEFLKSETKYVLCSPSMTEGLDLKDKLSRFQILVKVPYPYVKDKIIDAKMKLDDENETPRNKTWYNWKTMISLIQAYGRSIRDENDFAVTFTLDNRFESFCELNNKKMTKKVKYGFQYVDSLFKLSFSQYVRPFDEFLDDKVKEKFKKAVSKNNRNTDWIKPYL